MKVYAKASSSSDAIVDLSQYGPGKGNYSEYDSPNLTEEDEEFLYSAADSIFSGASDAGHGYASDFSYLSVEGKSTVDSVDYYYDVNVGDVLSDIESLRSRFRDYDKAEKFWYENLLPEYVEYYKETECDDEYEE